MYHLEELTSVVPNLHRLSLHSLKLLQWFLVAHLLQHSGSAEQKLCIHDDLGFLLNLWSTSLYCAAIWNALSSQEGMFYVLLASQRWCHLLRTCVALKSHILWMHHLEELTSVIPSGTPPATLWVSRTNTLHPWWSRFPVESMKHTICLHKDIHFSSVLVLHCDIHSL